MFLVSACKWASRNLFGEGCVACVEFVGVCTILPSCFSLCWGRREQQVHCDAPGQKNKHFSEYHLLQGQHGALGLWPSRERLQLGGASWAPLCAWAECWCTVGTHQGALCVPSAVTGHCTTSLMLLSEISAFGLQNISELHFPFAALFCLSSELSLSAGWCAHLMP